MREGTHEKTRFLAVALMLGVGCTAPPAFVLPDAALDPSEAGVAYDLQGEYQAPGGSLAAQVAAIADDRFRLLLLPEGFPPAGRRAESNLVANGVLDDGAAVFSGVVEASAANGILRGTSLQTGPFELHRVERESPTLGAPAPRDAIRLDDGARLEGHIDKTGHVERGARSRESFRDIELHLEYRLPFEPNGSEQLRGNSGVYLQNRYEIQILDSFARRAGATDAGAVYEQTPPLVNASLPPLAWQSYDILFRAPRFDENGAKTANARVTVHHNGVLVQDDTEIRGPTGRGEAEGPDARPLYLQDHGNPVVYRNVWVRPLPAARRLQPTNAK